MRTARISNRVSTMKPSGVRKFFALAATMDSCLDLSIGQPDFEVFPEFKQAASKAIELNHNSYTQSPGIHSARSVLRERYGIAPDSSHDVIITSGVMGGLFLSFSTFLDPGDEILIPDPYFVGYKEAALLLGATPVCFDTYPDFSPRREAIESRITSRTKAIVVSSPANPTGYVMTWKEVDMLENLALEHGLFLVYDEIYEHFCYDMPHARPSLSDHVVILNGISKSHAMTGWRIGWAIAEKSLIEQFEKVQQFTYVCAPSPFQNIIDQVIVSNENPMREVYKRKRDLVYQELSSKYEMEKPGGAFYFFPTSHFDTATSFVEEALKKKLLMIPGSVFSEQDTNFRLSYAVSDSVLEQALDILKALSVQ
jgi:aspartate/methionine/tyrosine aminotransferase